MKKIHRVAPEVREQILKRIKEEGVSVSAAAKAQEYIIAHELCHLREFNHSKRFWKLVSKIVPDYSEIRDELKKSGLSFY